MNIQIRPADFNDYHQVLNILEQVHKLHVYLRPDIYKKTNLLMEENVFKEKIRTGSYYVAEVNGNVVGILDLIFKSIDSLAHNQRKIIIIDVIGVDQNHQNLGIGTKLLDKAKNIKDRNGFDSIELNVNSANSNAYELYKKYGFTEKSITLELK
ncbi:GNAT family N-acetyltransferase [Faecalitalea cylindroides]|uniref:GNAT family N-acetyltransferase n=1 Tax=Faecalitalea cylindroides TaxID=39483 RepID=UPI0022E08116|nr:GNAT family N-acetyltransferase [Faecalitalea cylindroides]